MGLEIMSMIQIKVGNGPAYTCSFAYFLEYVLLFLNDNVDEECE